MDTYIIAYESKRLNSPRHKQSYVDYIAFLTPKIWEIPEVRLSSFIREQLARKEIFFIGKDIRDVESNIKRLQNRFDYLRKRYNTGHLFKEEKEELTRLSSTIRKQIEWKKTLHGFRTTLQEAFPQQTCKAALDKS